MSSPLTGDCHDLLMAARQFAKHARGVTIGTGVQCWLCYARVENGSDLDNPAVHSPKCPWRQIRESLDRMDAGLLVEAIYD